VLDHAGEKIGKGARVISVIIPNVQGIKEQSWRSYLSSIDAVEKATGYDLLSNVPVDVQKVIEARVD
jgi:endonuclease G